MVPPACGAPGEICELWARTSVVAVNRRLIPVEHGVGEHFRMDAAQIGEEDQLNSKKAVTLVML